MIVTAIEFAPKGIIKIFKTKCIIVRKINIDIQPKIFLKKNPSIVKNDLIKLFLLNIISVKYKIVRKLNKIPVEKIVMNHNLNVLISWVEKLFKKLFTSLTVVIDANSFNLSAITGSPKYIKHSFITPYNKTIYINEKKISPKSILIKFSPTPKKYNL